MSIEQSRHIDFKQSGSYIFAIKIKRETNRCVTPAGCTQQFNLAELICCV